MITESNIRLAEQKIREPGKGRMVDNNFKIREVKIKSTDQAIILLIDELKLKLKNTETLQKEIHGLKSKSEKYMFTIIGIIQREKEHFTKIHP